MSYLHSCFSSLCWALAVNGTVTVALMLCTRVPRRLQQGGLSDATVADTAAALDKLLETHVGARLPLLLHLQALAKPQASTT